MSTKTLKLFYRNLCKDLKLNNLFIYRDFIHDEIKRINDVNMSINTKNKEKEYYENFMSSYIKMKNHIKAENELLESYNINIKRDSKKEIENVAKRVGLRINF